MWRFRPHLRVGPFVWTPDRRRRARVPSMPSVTVPIVAGLVLGLALMVGIIWLWG